MLTQAQQVDLTVQYMHQEILAAHTASERSAIEKTEDWQKFSQRLRTHFPSLMWELNQVYGTNEAVLPMFETSFPQGVFAAASGVVTACALLARVLAQKDVSDGG